MKPHTWNLPWCGVVSNMTSTELVAKEQQKRLQPHHRVFFDHWTSQPRKTKRHGLKVDGAIFRTWQCYRRLTANFRNAVAPCMDFSMHVPNGSLMIALQLTSNLRINRSISHGSEYCLCIGVQAYFYGWCNTMRQVDGTTQEFCGWYFQSL